MKGVKYVVFLTVFVLLVGVAVHNANADQTSIYTQSLYDDTGYKYGTKFFVRNNTGGKCEIRAHVAKRENVTGEVIIGWVPLDSQEEFCIGTFVQTDPSRPWSVLVGHESLCRGH